MFIFRRVSCSLNLSPKQKLLSRTRKNFRRVSCWNPCGNCNGQSLHGPLDRQTYTCLLICILLTCIGIRRSFFSVSAYASSVLGSMLTFMHHMAPGFWSQNPEFRGTLRRSRISMIRAAVSTTPALLVSSSHGNPRNICKDSSDSRSMEQDSSRGYDRSMQQPNSINWIPSWSWLHQQLRVVLWSATLGPFAWACCQLHKIKQPRRKFR